VLRLPRAYRQCQLQTLLASEEKLVLAKQQPSKVIALVHS
jgi:hypothetical protein